MLKSLTGAAALIVGLCASQAALADWTSIPTLPSIKLTVTPALPAAPKIIAPVAPKISVPVKVVFVAPVKPVIAAPPAPVSVSAFFALAAKH